MNYIGWLTRHGRAILFVVFALAVAGIYAGITLPVGLFPVTSFPRIRIEISTGSMPAKQMLIDVTEPLEEAARAVAGRDRCYFDDLARQRQKSSSISRGQGDMNQALLATDAAFAQKLPDLPAGTSYDILQMSPSRDFAVRLICAHLGSGLVGGSAKARSVSDHAVADRNRGYPACRRPRRRRRRRSRWSIDPQPACRGAPDARRCREGALPVPMSSQRWAGSRTTIFCTSRSATTPLPRSHPSRTSPFAHPKDGSSGWATSRN